jgi:hypothetical protein
VALIHDASNQTPTFSDRATDTPPNGDILLFDIVAAMKACTRPPDAAPRHGRAKTQVFHRRLEQRHRLGLKRANLPRLPRRHPAVELCASRAESLRLTRASSV